MLTGQVKDTLDNRTSPSPVTYELRYDTGEEPAEPAPLPPRAVFAAVEKSAEELSRLF